MDIGSMQGMVRSEVGGKGNCVCVGGGMQKTGSLCFVLATGMQVQVVALTVGF